MKEYKVFSNNPSLTGFARIVPDVVFSTETGVELKLTLLHPWNIEGKKYPLVVFLQGSAWTFPDVCYEIPQLSALARQGYVVATITHRNSLEGHPFPAYLEDTKTAIRFLRANADQYGIDPNRVCMWGTSSGGNTALLVGLTGDDPAFRTGEYAAFSDAVQLVVECFGPSDLPKMIDPARAEADPEGAKLIMALKGDGDLLDVMRRMSPVNYVKKGEKYPPFLLLHGDADDVVPYAQSEEMLDALQDACVDARLVRIEGAPHEGSFWSDGLVEEIHGFIREKL